MNEKILKKIEKAKKYNFLSLSDVEINTEIWNKIIKLINLKTLSLVNIKIDNFKGLEKLINLEKLLLSNNNLHKFPEEIFSLTNLKELDLVNNEIKTKPKQIYKLKKLEILRLSDNKIEYLAPDSDYISSCEIKNFKIFRHIKATFSKNINVLIGNNGLGKTTLLQALTLALLPSNNTDKSNEFENFITFGTEEKDTDILIQFGENEKRDIKITPEKIDADSYLHTRFLLAYGVNLNTSEKLSHDEIIQDLITGKAKSYSTKSIFKDNSNDFFDPIILIVKITVILRK